MSCVYGIQEVRGSIPLSSTINIRLCADFFYVFLLKIYLRKTTRCGALQVLTETLPEGLSDTEYIKKREIRYKTL